MLIKNFKLFVLSSMSILLLFSCSTDLGEEDVVSHEISKRDVSEAFAVAKDTCKPNRVDGSTYHTQKLDLTGKDLGRQSGESVEDFLARLGYDTSVLCTGGCATGGEECVVTNVFNSINSDLGAVHGNGSLKIIRKFYPRSNSQDMSCVSVRIRAVCKCK